MNKILYLLTLITLVTFYSPNNSYAVSNLTEDEFTEFTEDGNNDEFTEFTEDSNSEDEFSSFDENGDDEFSSFDENESSKSSCETSCSSGTCSTESSHNKNKDIKYYWIFGMLFFTILAGIFVRFKKTRKLRVFFLLTSIFILGFYKHGCTVCPINGIENIILYLSGHTVHFVNLIWFLAIIPITYIFGKVWCGWVCHLGAIQEFLYFPRKVKILDTAKAQKIFRIIRYVLLIALIIQLSIMGSKYWCQIDPFVNIFDFKSFFDYLLSVKNYDLGLIIIITLLLYVLISSMFIYRPFCRTICPIGLVLGWITRIPGASLIGIKGACISCKMCNSTCELDAITRDNKISSVIYNPDCNSCGRCLDSCVKDGLSFVRKNKEHTTIVKCENNCKIENKK